MAGSPPLTKVCTNDIILYHFVIEFFPIRWIYALFLAIDANFRLQRKVVSSDKVDPGLSNGWAFFVEEKKYKEHLAKHWDQKQEVMLFIDYCVDLSYSLNFSVALVLIMTQ